jgi:hypothetical protein
MKKRISVLFFCLFNALNAQAADFSDVDVAVSGLEEDQQTHR